LRRPAGFTTGKDDEKPYRMDNDDSGVASDFLFNRFSTTMGMTMKWMEIVFDWYCWYEEIIWSLLLMVLFSLLVASVFI